MPDPSLEEDLVDGFSITRDADGVYTLVRTFFARDLTGATPVDRFASALSLSGLPARGDTIVIDGTTVYAGPANLTPWPPADAMIKITYTERQTGLDIAGFGPIERESGTTLEQGETEFDADNLALPYANRTPISVEYDPTSSGAVGSGALPPQGGRVPILVPKSTRVFTREQTVDPADYAEDYVGRTNSNVWKGYQPETVLCLQIVGRNRGDGRWKVTHVFAIDKETKFRQFARYVLPDTGKPPKLSNGQLAAQNGIKEVIVQGSVAFSGPLTF
jgi:hypothetical protein